MNEDKKRDAKFAKRKSQHKSFEESLKKPKLSGRDKDGNIESVIARKAEQAQKKRESESSKKDTDILKFAKQARKDGASEEDIQRIHKHLSGAKKRKAVKSIVKSIE